MAGTHNDNVGLPSFVAGDSIAEHYVLCERLGVGSFGEVWRASDNRNPYRKVAIKLLKATVASPEAARRFEREAVALQLLALEPHVVQLWESGVWRGRRYLVLEYVEGLSLEQWLQNHRTRKILPQLDDALSLFLQICDGVAAAHRITEPGPIVHRDLKPSNVMLSSKSGTEHNAKVVDFGVAQLGAGPLEAHAPAAARLTDHGQQPGTPRYMAPEQLFGASQPISPATDVFALGLLLVELLTLDTRGQSGEPLAQIVLRHNRDTHHEALLSQLLPLRPEVPDAIWNIAAQALSAVAQERPVDAGALADALRKRRPIPALTAASAASSGPRSSQAQKSAQRRSAGLHRRRAALPIFLLLGLGILGALAVHEVRTAPPAVQARGDFLLVRPWPLWGAPLAHFQMLCRAAAGGGSVPRCGVAPAHLQGPAQIARWAKSSNAAVIAVMDRAGMIELFLKGELPFSVGPLGLPEQGMSEPSAQHLLRMLSELSVHLSPPATTQSLPLPRAPIGFLGAEAIGQEAVALTAFVRYLRHGPRPPDGTTAEDPELAQLRQLAEQCQRADALTRWYCPMVRFLYAVRCNCEEATPLLAEIAVNPRASALQLRNVQLQMAKQLCLFGRKAEAAALVAQLSQPKGQFLCADSYLLPIASCIVLSRSSPPSKQPPGLTRSSSAQQPATWGWLLQLTSVDAERVAACPASSPTDVSLALGGRGYFEMCAGRWEQAEADLKVAYARSKHPTHLLNRAEALLHIPQRQHELLRVLDWNADMLLLSGGAKLKAVFLRWLVSRAPFDAGVLRSLYDATPIGQSVLPETDGSLRLLLCARPSEAGCAVYKILVMPKLSDSTDRLRSAIDLPAFPEGTQHGEPSTK